MATKFIFTVALVASFVSFSSSYSTGGGNPIEGNFQLDDSSPLQSPEMDNLLKIMQLSPGDIEKVKKASNVKIAVKREGAGYHYSIKGLIGDVEISKSFESGKEFKNKRFDGKEYKGKITIVGRTGVREADFGAFKTHHVATFMPECLELLFTAEKGSEFGKSRLNFKRA